MRGVIAFLLSLFIITVAIGCSGGNGSQSPVLPGTDNETVGSELNNPGGHVTLGLYQFTADKAKETLDITPLRTSQFHLNALPFLEPPPLVNLTLESLHFDGDMVEADIGLRHPFVGLTEFTGFDVSGILITDGSYSGFNDTSIRYAGPGDTRLLNPDGYGRWWNPSEFPVNPPAKMYGYNDGLLGTADAIGHYNSTLNAYKYFCDDLADPDSPMSDVTQANRGMFSAGQKNIRHYSIHLGAGLVFNYAIDECWQFPNGNYPWEAPADFGEKANRVEPWNIVVDETGNTLYYDNGDTGGELNLSIDVYDWYHAEGNALYVEAANGIIPQVGPIAPTGGGEGYSTYAVDITEAYPTGAGDLNLLITVETEEEDFGGYINGTNTSAYMIYTTQVGDTAPTQPEDPVIVDDHGAFGPVIGLDENGVIHSAYADQTNLYWSYSADKGADWVNMDDIYHPSGDLEISGDSISMWPGPDDGYVYIAWSEWSQTSVHRALWAGRMPTDLSGNFDAVMVWEHTTGYSEQGYDTTQIVATNVGDFLIYSMFYYQYGGGFRPVYNRVSSFEALEGCAELEVNSYLSGGLLVYIYTGYTQEMCYDSSGNVYFLNSGRYNNPGYARGSFILRNSVSTGTWDFYHGYIPTGNYNNVWYWDNRTNGMFIDESDTIHCISEWQTGTEPQPADDHGTYSMIYGTGPAGGTINWTDPIPDMQRGTPLPGYTNARFDDEWISGSCVEDGNGLVYIVFQDCVNKRDAYYITFDGTDWHHTDSWVKINTTTDQNAYLPYAIRGLDGYIYVTYCDRHDNDPGKPVFVAMKDAS